LNWEAFDQALWSCAIALSLGALYLSLPRPRGWTPEALLKGIHGEEGPDPLEWFGAGVGWPELRRWVSGEDIEAVEKVLLRRFSGIRALWLEEPSLKLSGLEPVRFTPGVLNEEREKQLAASLGDKQILAFADAECLGMLELLKSAPGLRDRLVGVALLGELPQAWIEDHFTHENFDLERFRLVPYFSRVPLKTPPLPANGRGAIEALELPEGERELVLVVVGML
jgi:hypothetical protein